MNDPVQRRDYLWVAGFTILLFGIVLAAGGPLTLHEGVLSQTTKAMLANQDWLVPRYGDAPWLERPPLPQWISCAICTLIGECDQEWNVRIGPALAGMLTVLITLWLAGRLFGRRVGIVSALALATMYNFLRYSTLAEADIFLAPIVAAAIAFFAYAEIVRFLPAESETPPAPEPPPESINPVGARPWCVLGFFVMLGMTNLVKGLVFGTVIVLAAVGTFLVWNFSWRSIARYCWLWGIVAFAAVALPWPLLVYQRFPDAAEVWHFDLFGRLNQHYLEEPAWYYFVCLTWVPQPWTIAAIAGLALSFKHLWRNGSPALRFVWCWAWMPLLVFSLSHGKHHHYMLHYLAPWAILAAQGTLWAWDKVGEHWQKRWYIPLGIAIAGDVALAFIARKIPGPDWTLPLLLTAFPLLVGGLWWFGFERRPAVAVIGSFAMILLLYAGFFVYKGAYLHRSREDTAFLFEARKLVPPDQPLMLNSADEALEGLRMQYYIGDSVYFLHNLSFVRDDRIHTPDVYVVTRYNRLPQLEKYGTLEPLLKCKQARRESSEADRWTLFRLHLRDDFERKSAAVRISPMQAMYRHPGPDLD